MRQGLRARVHETAMPASKPPVVIAFTNWDLDPWLKRFRAADPEREYIVLTAPDMALPEKYYLCCWKPDPAVFRRTPAPLLISSPGAGVDHIMKADPPAHIPITRIVDPNLTGRMVEYIVLHALYHFRQMTAYAGFQRAHRWVQLDQPKAADVAVGIMGMGELGLAAAAGLKAVGFTVSGWSRSPKAAEGVEMFHGAAGLDAFLAGTDILVSLLPSTPGTRGLVDRGLLGKLRSPGPLGGPAFINAGRGDAVNDADMVACLSDGTLRAASLDVFTHEPLAADSPYWDMPNVIVTPHVAADSDPDAIAVAVMTEIARFEAGLPPLFPVDRARGY